jgi:heme o synthase
MEPVRNDTSKEHALAFVDDTNGTNRASLVSQATPGDFIALLKPRVMSLVVFTALVGIVVAPGSLHPLLAAASLLSIAVGAGASGALNMWYDADIDALMSRTAKRPIPAGRVTSGEALTFGLILSVLSVLVLGLVANWLSAGLLAFTIFFYAVVYTMWLKRWTPQNIVIGGAAGAFPPMIGWAAVTGTISIESIVLFLIIFFWTPPHFWALALLKSDDYARAGVPMLPVVAGEAETRRQILIYSVLLAPLGVAPWFLGFAGIGYAVAAILGGLGMLAGAVQVYRRREGAAARKAAGRLFGFSLIYLFALFAVLLVEQGLIARFM